MAEEAPKDAPAAAEQPKQDAEAAPKEAAAQPASSFPPPPNRRRALRLGLGSLSSGLLLAFAVALGILTLVAWLVYRPHKPRFYVDGASIYDLNVTDGSVSSDMQFTVLFQNPNRRWSIRYDELVAFVTYRGQLITMVTPLPSLYQGHRSLLPVYTYVAGNFVPVFPDVAGGLVADEGYGLVDLRLQIKGRYRWKTSFWRSMHYHLYVTCDLLVGLKDRVNDQVPLFQGQRCDVDV